MATVYLVCGNTGAGKSTYSMDLAREKSAILFSIDQWMQQLYGTDYQAGEHDMAWLLERDERCKALMREQAAQALYLGVDVVFDMTFGQCAMRQRYRDWADGIGALASLHYLDVDIQTRRSRVHRRNAQKGETFRFTVTDAMFDYVETMFEAPGQDELVGGKTVRP